MKKMIFAMIVAMSFGLTNVSSATTTDAERQSAQATTEKDAVALQKSVKELGQMFGVEQPKKEEPKKAETSSVEKTVAQVMDKAIDKVSDVVGAMAQAINKIAPDVWRIMIKQQYAKAVGYVVVPLGAVLVCLAAFFAANARRKHMLAVKEDDPEKPYPDEIEFFWWVKLVSSALIGVSGLWFANRIADAALFLINPEFYAIQDLLRMILNKGM